MKLPVRLKITVSLGIIVLVSLGLTLWTAVYVTRIRYTDYELWKDQSRARVLASFLAQNTDGSGLLPGSIPMEASGNRKNDRAKPPRDAMMRLMDNLGRQQKGRNNRHHPSRGDNPARYRDESIILAQTDGTILLNTTDRSKHTLDPLQDQAVPVVRDGATVAYVYVGQMIPGYSSNETFLFAVKRAVLLISAAVFALAMVLGLLLTRHIVKPIHLLNRAAGKVTGGDFSVRIDLSRRDELGELSGSFNTMAESLEQAETRRRQMIADSAHELRTPVSLIRTRLELVQEGIYAFDHETLGHLQKESERLVHLVDDLRLLADLETKPGNETVRDRLLLEELVKKAVQASLPMADARNIRIESDPEPGFVQGSAFELHRLLLNLISNALRYAHSRVRLTTRTDRSRTRIRVEDDGPGIPETERDKVFDRYYRTDSSRTRDSGGLGLGLSICREIVRAHGGQIQCTESDELQGACLVVELPVSG